MRFVHHQFKSLVEEGPSLQPLPLNAQRTSNRKLRLPRLELLCDFRRRASKKLEFKTWGRPSRVR
jgi:hypothetical protein